MEYSGCGVIGVPGAKALEIETGTGLKVASL